MKYHPVNNLQGEQMELLMVAMLCQGHILLEDVPGTGKTMLARSMAVSMGMNFKRLQCTPDLLPNDIIGVHIFLQNEGRFEFRPTPAAPVYVRGKELDRLEASPVESRTTREL